MTELIFPYLLFLMKSITIVVCILVIMAMVSKKAKKEDSLGKIELLDLSEKLEKQTDDLYSELMSEKEYKSFVKNKTKRMDNNKKSRLFVLSFDGDTFASANECLKEEITAILMIATPNDEVLLKLESPGGTVIDYGLASSQLQRLRERGIHLTVSVDRVAASGGYMMACVANRIVSAPFGTVGSIGVVAEFPNFYRFLKKHDIDMEVMTAGESKRTITILGEMTPEGREKFIKQLEETHTLFKNLVSKYRPQLDIEKIATGEHWYGIQALELGLVDSIATSDDLILEAVKEKQVYEVKFKEKKKWANKFGIQLANVVEILIQKLFQQRRKIM